MSLAEIAASASAAARRPGRRRGATAVARTRVAWPPAERDDVADDRRAAIARSRHGRPDEAAPPVVETAARRAATQAPRRRRAPSVGFDRDPPDGIRLARPKREAVGDPPAIAPGRRRRRRFRARRTPSAVRPGGPRDSGRIRRSPRGAAGFVRARHRPPGRCAAPETSNGVPSAVVIARPRVHRRGPRRRGSSPSPPAAAP